MRSLIPIFSLPFAVHSSYQVWLAQGTGAPPNLLTPLPALFITLFAAEVLTFFFHAKHRRLGDFLGDTVVVWKEHQPWWQVTPEAQPE